MLFAGTSSADPPPACGVVTADTTLTGDCTGPLTVETSGIPDRYILPSNSAAALPARRVSARTEKGATHIDHILGPN